MTYILYVVIFIAMVFFFFNVHNFKEKLSDKTIISSISPTQHDQFMHRDIYVPSPCNCLCSLYQRLKDLPSLIVFWLVGESSSQIGNRLLRHTKLHGN